MDLRENLVVCIGSPMIDVTARVSYDFLQKYDLKPNNAVSYNRGYSQIFPDLEKCTHTTSVGGSITNTARSAQTILSFPGAFSYIGAIGKDDAGAKIRQTAQADGVNVFFEEIEDCTTGRCAVLLFENNRSFVTDLGASKYLSIEFLERSDIKNVIIEAHYYYASALFLRVNCEIIKKICTLSQRYEKKFIFNIGAPSLCLQYLKEFEEILPYVNLLIGNEEESRQLANVFGHDCKDIEGVSQFLLAQCENSENGHLNETCMIITRGDKPLIMANRDGVRKFEVPPLGIGRILNTSGAGDHFVAGLLVNYIQNKSLEESVYGGIRSSVEFIKKNSSILN